MARGLDLLGPGAAVRRNRVMLGDRQVRLGHDGRWYPFRKDTAGRWNPDGEPLTVVPDDGDLGELPEEGDAG